MTVTVQASEVWPSLVTVTLYVPTAEYVTENGLPLPLEGVPPVAVQLYIPLPPEASSLAEFPTLTDCVAGEQAGGGDTGVTLI